VVERRSCLICCGTLGELESERDKHDHREHAARALNGSLAAGRIAHNEQSNTHCQQNEHQNQQRTF